MVSAQRLAEIVERLSAERRPDRLAQITLGAALVVTGGRAARLVGPAGPQGQAQLAVEGVVPPYERPATVDLPGRDGPLGRIEVWGAVDDPSALAALRLVAFHCARTLENEDLRRIRADDRRRARRLTAAVTALREAVDPAAAVAVGLTEARALAGAPAAALVVTTSGRLEVAACDGIEPRHEPGAAELVPEAVRAGIGAGRPWVGRLALDSPMRMWGFGSALIVGVGAGAGFGFLVMLGDDGDPFSEDAAGTLVRVRRPPRRGADHVGPPAGDARPRGGGPAHAPVQRPLLPQPDRPGVPARGPDGGRAQPRPGRAGRRGRDARERPRRQRGRRHRGPGAAPGGRREGHGCRLPRG